MATRAVGMTGELLVLRTDGGFDVWVPSANFGERGNTSPRWHPGGARLAFTDGNHAFVREPPPKVRAGNGALAYALEEGESGYGTSRHDHLLTSSCTRRGSCTSRPAHPCRQLRRASRDEKRALRRQLTLERLTDLGVLAAASHSGWLDLAG